MESHISKDGNDLDAIDKAITKAKSQNGPTMIEVKTIIGYGAPNVSGTNGVHGAPLGSDERKLTFEAYGLDLRNVSMCQKKYMKFSKQLC